jgi:hypothetical protein
MELGPPRWEAGDLPPELWHGLSDTEHANIDGVTQANAGFKENYVEM